MALLAESYVHLKHYRTNPGKLQALAVSLQEQCPLIAGKFYDHPVEIGIRVEEGSLKTWVVVAGCLWTALGPAYEAVSNYPAFKGGIKELFSDAKEFGESVAALVKQESGARPRHLYRIERRAKLVGKIHRLIRTIESLEETDLNSGK